MAVRRAPARPRPPLRLQPLEGRDAPAGLAAVSVSPAGMLTLSAVLGRDGDEILSVSRRVDGAYVVTPASGTVLRARGIDTTDALPVFGPINGLAASLGAGNDQVTLNGAFFTGSVAVNLGTGNNTLNVFDAQIGGGLAVTAGGGIDTVFFAGTAVGVAGAFTAQLGDGTNLVRTDLSRAAFGSFRVAGGVGNDVLSIAGNDLTFTALAGGLTFNGGGGSNTVTLGDGAAEVAVAGPVTITGRGPANAVAIGGTRFDAGALRLGFGGGENTLTATAPEFRLTGGLSWASGAGTDTVQLFGTDARIGGAVWVAAGDGVADIRLRPTEFLSIGRGLAVRTGTGLARRTILIGGGADTVVGGPVAVAAGAGDVSLDLFSPETMAVTGPVTVSHGPGDGSMRVGSAGRLLVSESIRVTQAGARGSSVVTGFAPAAIGGSVVLAGGAGQTVGISGGVIGGGVTMTGAAASAFLGTIGAVPLRVRGPVLVASGSAAGQAATVAVRELQAEGPVAVRGGAGNDLLRIDNCAFLGSFTVDLGGGADRLELEQEAPCGAGVPSGFAGPVLVRGGSGADAFVLGGDVSDRAVAFRNAVAVDGGAGSDTVAVGSLVTFDPAHPLAQINIA